MAGAPPNETGAGQGADQFRIDGRPRHPLEVTQWNKDRVQQRLSIYGPAALMVDSIGIYGNGYRGFAKVQASGPAFRPILAGEVEVGGSIGKYAIRDEDIQDHFTIEGNPKHLIIPGVRTVAIARLSTDRVRKRGTHLSRISDVKFAKPAGEGATLFSLLQKSESEGGDQFFDVKIKAKGSDVADLKLEYGTQGPINDPRIHIAPELAVESAAQAAGLLLQHRRGWENMDDNLPRFDSIDEVKILQSLKKGEEFSVDVSFEETEDGLVASARILKPDLSVAQVITGIRAKIDTARRAKVGLRMGTLRGAD